MILSLHGALWLKWPSFFILLLTRGASCNGNRNWYIFLLLVTIFSLLWSFLTILIFPFLVHSDSVALQGYEAAVEGVPDFRQQVENTRRCRARHLRPPPLWLLVGSQHREIRTGQQHWQASVLSEQQKMSLQGHHPRRVATAVLPVSSSRRELASPWQRGGQCWC